MGNEYSYETPAEGEASGDATTTTADATAVSTSEASGASDQPATKEANDDEGDDESKKKNADDPGDGGGGDSDPPEDNEKADGDGGDDGDSSAKTKEETESPPSEEAAEGGTKDDAAASTEEAQAAANDDKEPPSQGDENGTSDEEVARARALAQFIQKYGSELTPEQIANITPEQIDRLTRVGSTKTSAPPPKALRPMPPRPIVEMREYDLNPMYAHSYLHHTAAKADLRKQLSPLRLFCLPETGGKLNVATHLYHWRGGYQERNARKSDMASNEEWKDYIKKVQPALISQRSSLWMEAPFVYEMPGVTGLDMGRGESMVRMGGKYSNNAVYEVCRYKLKLGYDVIPTFLDLYANGLPSKLNVVGSDPTSNLITLMYSTVGTLNEVVEIWRHGGGFDAMERSGAAAQNAKEWRESGSKISELTVEVTRTVFRPIAFSPLL